MRIPGPPEHWSINPLPFIGVVFALVALFFLIQIRIVTLAFERLGLGPGAACALLAGSLLASVINIPVLRIRTERAAPTPVHWLYQGMLRFPVLHHENATITAAIVALSLDAAHAPALAYISGTLGVLLGADLLKLWRVARLGAPVLSVGGAGTFDGIFLTGVLAVLLA